MYIHIYIYTHTYGKSCHETVSGPGPDASEAGAEAWPEARRSSWLMRDLGPCFKGFRGLLFRVSGLGFYTPLFGWVLRGSCNGLYRIYWGVLFWASNVEWGLQAYSVNLSEWITLNVYLLGARPWPQTRHHFRGLGFRVWGSVRTPTRTTKPPDPERAESQG